MRKCSEDATILFLGIDSSLARNASARRKLFHVPAESEPVVHPRELILGLALLRLRNLDVGGDLPAARLVVVRRGAGAPDRHREHERHGKWNGQPRGPCAHPLAMGILSAYR